MKPKKSLLQKLQSYCAYQERSHFEVRQKLFEEKVYGDTADQVISCLIEDNFLSEERFAMAYAGGKFRMKQWGRVKIKMGLRQKQVPEKLINKALQAITTVDYLETLKEVLEKKNALVNEKNALKRKHLLINYAVSRGFERDTVYEMLSG